MGSSVDTDEARRLRREATDQGALNNASVRWREAIASLLLSVCVHRAIVITEPGDPDHLDQFVMIGRRA